VTRFTTCQQLFISFVDVDEGPASIELPNQWLWDIVDEFIYQFESFWRYRSKPRPSDDKVDVGDAWKVKDVLGYLYTFIEKSNIQKQLAAINEAEAQYVKEHDLLFRTLVC
jgi:translation initiation factor 3 subunit L